MHKLLLVLFLLLSISTFSLGFSDDGENSGVFGKLKSGLKLAGKILGIDIASEVAKLVNQNFAKAAKPQRKGDTGQTGTNIFSGFFRLLGLESKKLGAIAVNALVFIAQLISTSLSRPVPSQLSHARKLRPGTPFDWITNNSNEQISEILKAAKDPELPNKVVEYLKNSKPSGQTDCVQLLICKTAPFMWGMQKAIKSKAPSTRATGTSGMYKYMPTMEEIVNQGDNCEEQYPQCQVD